MNVIYRILDCQAEYDSIFVVFQTEDESGNKAEDRICLVLTPEFKKKIEEAKQDIHEVTETMQKVLENRISELIIQKKKNEAWASLIKRGIESLKETENELTFNEFEI